MKKLFALLAVSIIAVLPAKAQTNVSTNLGQTLSIPPSVITLWNQLGTALNDTKPYFSNDIGNFALGGLYDKAIPKGKLGMFAMATVPTSLVASNQTSVGFAGCYLGKQWLDANVTLQLGTTVNKLPLLGSVYLYVASGPDYNFQTRSVGAFNFAGFQYNLFPHASKTWYFSINGGAGNVSTFPGTVWELGFQASKHF